MPMSDADELRIIAETVAMMNKHTAARLMEIADRVDALTRLVPVQEVNDQITALRDGLRGGHPPEGD
ncbi:MAG TPA: hypothetical protein VD866_01535 [Urbifossiella sp.]|nr:hypothetical protein [Urbifossiella sp.]